MMKATSSCPFAANKNRKWILENPNSPSDFFIFPQRSMSRGEPRVRPKMAYLFFKRIKPGDHKDRPYESFGDDEFGKSICLFLLSFV
jgi:hypothetical protein